MKYEFSALFLIVSHCFFSLTIKVENDLTQSIQRVWIFVDYLSDYLFLEKIIFQLKTLLSQHVGNS